MKKTLLTLTVALTLNACQQIQNPVADGNLNPNNSNQIVSPQNLDFSRIQGVEKSLEINGQTIAYIAYENIVYVTNPVDTRYQTLNIYIPKAYFNQQSIDGFTADTAPIFFPNNVGGYMPAKAGTVGLGRDGKPNAISVALSKGYVVASAGARGRSETTGKAPAAIIDLKAAVRYLRANDKIMAGDAKKI
ncbi:MAG: alpha/beta hydrolase, partial [Neisseria sp.]|nr:alpha/beta hydrolase [Neisseria sp.]